MCQEKDVRAAASVELVGGRSRKVHLVKGLPRKQLFQAIHYHARNGEVSNRALGFYLLDLERRREHQEPGSVSALQYAQGALGKSEKEARDVIRVARELEELPGLDRAFARGEIAWSKLREVVRVSVRETELEWLAFAREHNCREVEAAVSRVHRGQKPPDSSDLGTPRVRFRIQYDLPAALNATWQTAVEKLMAEIGEGATPLDALKAMSEMAIATNPDRKTPPGRHERKEPIYMVVYHIGPDGQAWHQAQDGQEPIPLEAALAVKESAEVIEVPDLEARTRTARPRSSSGNGGARPWRPATGRHRRGCGRSSLPGRATAARSAGAVRIVASTMWSRWPTGERPGPKDS